MELEGERINYKQLLKRLNFPRSAIDKTSCKLYWQSMRAYMYVIAFQTLRAMDEWNSIRIKNANRAAKIMAKNTCTLDSLTNYNHHKKSFWRRGSNLK